jgi:hypothetical protein
VFKPGEKVRCIDNSGLEASLTLNEIYTVEYHAKSSYNNMVFLERDNIGEATYFPYLAKRFEKCDHLRWISIKDHAPQGSGYYLVCNSRYQDVGISYYCAIGDEWGYVGEFNIDVTHWMPLPEPPK